VRTAAKFTLGLKVDESADRGPIRRIEDQPRWDCRGWACWDSFSSLQPSASRPNGRFRTRFGGTTVGYPWAHSIPMID